MKANRQRRHRRIAAWRDPVPVFPQRSDNLQLSTGVFVPDGVAKAVVARPDTIGSDAGLFNNSPSQTWRFTND